MPGKGSTNYLTYNYITYEYYLIPICLRTLMQKFSNVTLQNLAIYNKTMHMFTFDRVISLFKKFDLKTHPQQYENT